MRIIIEIDGDNKTEVKKEDKEQSNEVAHKSSSNAINGGGAKVDNLTADPLDSVDYEDDTSSSKNSSQSKAMDAGAFDPGGSNEQQEGHRENEAVTSSSQSGKAKAAIGKDAGSAKALENSDTDTSIEQTPHVLSAADKANAIDGGGFGKGDAESIA